ncbi:hypothetical protein PSTG_01129 [Puccinia striiformis f. sp. tritici PST-78]|uniref:CCHC-type domain-containing protein n=1 Tax=Puccinia striiformis f. sp. tritici PST-78 TaxID=1165861 RepID=A0A0L0W2I9_9BASI|nr:hypothetical protein PSTG_01129 [Puccinia striiformis f. sp. tritici PST-78]
MDLSAFRGQLSETEKLKMMRNGQCFRCAERGHLARDCPKKGKGKETARISELEEENRLLKLAMTRNSEGSKADQSKNGGAQE